MPRSTDRPQPPSGCRPGSAENSVVKCNVQAALSSGVVPGTPLNLAVLQFFTAVDLPRPRSPHEHEDRQLLRRIAAEVARQHTSNVVGLLVTWDTTHRWPLLVAGGLRSLCRSRRPPAGNASVVGADFTLGRFSSLSATGQCATSTEHKDDGASWLLQYRPFEHPRHSLEIRAKPAS